MTDFYEAVCLLYKEGRAEPNLFKPMNFYCRLLDLLASNLEGRERAVQLYRVDSRISIISSVFAGGGDVKDRYGEVSDVLSEEEFSELSDTLLRIAKTDGKIPAKQNSSPTKPPSGAVKKSRAAKPKRKVHQAANSSLRGAPAKAAVKHQPTPKKASPRPSAKKTTPSKHKIKRRIDPAYITAGAFFVQLAASIFTVISAIAGIGAVWYGIAGGVGVIAWIVMLLFLVS